MKHLFVSYDIARLLKENGFDEECLCYYDHSTSLQFKRDMRINASGIKRIDCHESNTLAPIYQQVVDWLRTRNVLIEIVPLDDWNNWIYKMVGEGAMEPFFEFDWNKIEYKTYYEALNAAIEEALKLT